MGRALSHPLSCERACVFKDRARTHTFSSLPPLPCLGPCEAKQCRGMQAVPDYFMKYRRIKLRHIMHITRRERKFPCAAAAKVHFQSRFPTAVCTLHFSAVDSALWSRVSPHSDIFEQFKCNTVWFLHLEMVNFQTVCTTRWLVMGGKAALS